MNKNQKSLSYGALACFVISVLFAPWEKTLSTDQTTLNLGTSYSPVWEPPSAAHQVVSTVKLRVDSLIVEWVAIGVVFFALFKILRTEPSISNGRHR